MEGFTPSFVRRRADGSTAVVQRIDAIVNLSRGTFTRPETAITAVPFTPLNEPGNGDQDSANDGPPTSKVHWLCLSLDVIYPYESWKQQWDVLIMFLILYSSVSVPYRIAFREDAAGWMWAFETLGSIIFMMDLTFAFRTAYIEGAIWETRGEEIAKRYLSGWFWIDGPSSIPAELIELAMGGGSANLQAVRMLRLFRLLRLLKLLKISEFIDNLEDRFDIRINMRFVNLLSLLCQLIFTAHLLGCGWFFTTWFPDEESGNWLERLDQNIHREVHEKYLLCIYWAFTTITSVGYGDIVAVSTTEIAYVTCALIVSALVFSYMIGQIGCAIASLDRQTSHVDEKMDAIKEYIAWRRIPKHLGLRLRRYYEHYYRERPHFDETEILSCLNPMLNAEVVKFVLREKIGKLAIFEKLSPEFHLAAFSKLRPGSFKPGEVIFRRGDASRDLLFLMKGEVAVLLRADERITEARITPAQQFRLDFFDGSVSATLPFEGALGADMLLGRRRTKSHMAITECEVFSIVKEDMVQLLQHDPQSSRFLCRSLVSESRANDKLDSLCAKLRINMLTADGTGELRAALQIQYAARSLRNRVAQRDPLYELIAPFLEATAPDLSSSRETIVMGSGKLESSGGTSPADIRPHQQQPDQSTGGSGVLAAETSSMRSQMAAMRKQMGTMTNQMSTMQAQICTIQTLLETLVEQSVDNLAGRAPVRIPLLSTRGRKAH